MFFAWYNAGMTTPSSRFIAWEIPAEEQYAYKPGPQDFRFASWLLQQDPMASTDIDRLAHADDLVKHVGFKMAPSRPVAQRHAPYIKPIPGAYSDTRIQEEFVRWTATLAWDHHRQVYMRWANSVFNELASPWLQYTATTCPMFKFALGLAMALDIDDANIMMKENPSSLMHQKVAENALTRLAILGVPLSVVDFSDSSACDVFLTRTAEDTPAYDLRPFVEIFSSFYDSAKESDHPRHTARGINYYHSALFRAAIDTYKNALRPTDTLALPDAWNEQRPLCL